MTIAFGLKAVDGLVIAADREGTYGDQKLDEGKVTASAKGEPLGSLIITGAGYSAYLDSIAEELRDWFGDDKNDDIRKVGREVKKLHATFYRESILPFAAYPNEFRPDLSLLMGCSMKGHWPILWTIEGLAFRSGKPYDAVGVGGPTAISLLHKLYASVPVVVAVSLAAFVMHEVKRSVGGCGLGTDIIYTWRNMPQVVSSVEIEEMEAAFRKFRRIERESLHYCIASDLSQDVRPLGGADEREKIKAIFDKLNKARLERLPQLPPD